jgi:hypothetical protein
MDILEQFESMVERVKHSTVGCTREETLEVLQRNLETFKLVALAAEYAKQMKQEVQEQEAV